MDIQEIAPVLEAVLFTAGDSVEIRRIAKVIGAEPWEVREAAEKLAKSYEDRGSGLRLLRLEERLQLVTAFSHGAGGALHRGLLSARYQGVYRTAPGHGQLLYSGCFV